MPRRIVDLTLPIENHFRWPVQRAVKGSHAAGDVFEVTSVGLAVHGFTHMDSPRHMVPGGPTTSDVPLETTIGTACVIDLLDIAPRQAIDEALLADRAADLRPGDIALFKTDWGSQRAIATPAFWRDAPWLTRDAAEWLRAQKPKAAAFDFPQDHTIRLLLDGEVRPVEEHVTHDVLLRHGIILIEYLTNTAAIDRPRVELIVLPLKLPGADGAPVRAVAFIDD